MKRISIDCRPVFSLDEIADQYLSPSVKTLKSVINESLQKGASLLSQLNTSFVIAPLPGQLSLLGGERTMLLQKALEQLVAGGYTPAPIHYALGLLRSTDQCDMLISRFKDALRIETFACFPEQTFLDQWSRLSQLCIRRTRQGIVVDVSDYIKKNIVNYGKRFSGNVIRGLFFSSVQALEKSEETLDFSQKMIG